MCVIFFAFFQGTKNVGILTRNPLSIEDIVVKQYRAIKSRMVVISDFDSNKIKVELKSDCKKPGMFFINLFDEYFLKT